MNSKLERWLTTSIGFLGIIIAIIALVPAFLSLQANEPKLFYSTKINQIVLPEGLDTQEVLKLLTDNRIPHGRIDVQFINNGEGPAKKVVIRIVVNAKDIKVSTIPSSKDKVAWVNIGEPEIFQKSESVIVRQELSSFAIHKLFSFRVWFGYKDIKTLTNGDSEVLETLEIYYDDKPAILIGDISKAPKVTWRSHFKIPLYIFLGSIALVIVIALLMRIIRDPEFLKAVLREATQPLLMMAMIEMISRLLAYKKPEKQVKK